MLGSSTITRFSLFLVLVAPAPGLAGCGGLQTTSSHAMPKAGDMPDGGDWSGVYYSPTYGNLHLIKEGASVSGKWRTAAGDKWGEMSGDANGNIFHFEWKETKIGMVGPSATTNGRGYFQYVRPPGTNVNDEIRGEWGLGSEATGISWTAVKQRNQKPDPNSVMPDETQKIEGGGWDDEKKKKSSGGGDKGGSSDDGWN